MATRQGPVTSGASLESAYGAFTVLQELFTSRQMIAAATLNDLERRCREDVQYGRELYGFQTKVEPYRAWTRMVRGTTETRTLSIEAIIEDCRTMAPGEERQYALDTEPFPPLDRPALARGLASFTPMGWKFEPHWEGKNITIILAMIEKK